MKLKACGYDVDAAELLAALYNQSIPLGMGVLHYDPEPMTAEQAQEIIDQAGRFDFDYLKGRVMKVWDRDGEVDGRLYDRDNGPGAFEGIVLGLTIEQSA